MFNTLLLACSPLSLVCAIAVYFDARRLGSDQGQYGDFNNIGPRGWALLVLLLWLFGFPMYLYKRRAFKKIHQLREAWHNGKIDEAEFTQRKQALL